MKDSEDRSSKTIYLDARFNPFSCWTKASSLVTKRFRIFDVGISLFESCKENRERIAWLNILGWKRDERRAVVIFMQIELSFEIITTEIVSSLVTLCSVIYTNLFIQIG